MTFDFTGKKVLVAGGSRGIGRSIALGFAAFAVTAQAQTTEAPAPETAADPDAKVTGQTVVAIVNGEDITNMKAKVQGFIYAKAGAFASISK